MEKRFLCRIGKIKLSKLDEKTYKILRKPLTDFELKKNPTLYEIKKILLQRKAEFVATPNAINLKQIEKIDYALNYLKTVRVGSIQGGKRESVC